MALKRISDLPGATLPLTCAEEIELDVGGAARKCAVDDIVSLASAPDAEDVAYENATSGLTATDVQAAIDELAAGGGGGGTGDVVGPASSVADRIALFDGTTGKLLKDGGKTIG